MHNSLVIIGLHIYILWRIREESERLMGSSLIIICLHIYIFGYIFYTGLSSRFMCIFMNDFFLQFNSGRLNTRSLLDGQFHVFVLPP